MKRVKKLEKTILELVKEHSVNSKSFEESLLVESLEKLMSYNPLPSEKDSRNQVTEQLVRKWFSQKMRQKYDELSNELYELKREIEIKEMYFKNKDGNKKGSYENVEVEIPMLLKAELNKEEGWQKELEVGDYHYDSYRLTLFSRIPRVPLEVRKAGRDALSYAFKAYGEAIGNRVLGEVILQNPSYAPHPKDASLYVLWKPKPSDIHVEAKLIEKDPALVLKYGKSYLVSTWKEPDEEPFMDLISACRLSGLETYTKK